MISRLGLKLDNYKAVFRDIELIPEWDAEKCRWKDIVMTERQIAQWMRQYPGEVVEVETINSSSGDIPADKLPVTIARLTHQDGHISIQPEWKLFPLHPGNHKLWRNSYLEFTFVEDDVKRTMDLNAKFRNNKNVRLQKFANGKPICPWYLERMYCRKHDVTMFQAEMRTSAYTADDWWEEFDGKFDLDMCWRAVI